LLEKEFDFKIWLTKFLFFKNQKH